LSTNLPKLFTSLVLYHYYILVAQGRPPRLMLLVVYALQLFRSTTVLQAFCTEEIVKDAVPLSLDAIGSCAVQLALQYGQPSAQLQVGFWNCFDFPTDWVSQQMA
jgi:hypothetical protein